MPVDFPVSSLALPKSAAEAGRSAPAELYRERAAAGLIRADPAQQRAVARLQQLHEALARYPPRRPPRLEGTPRPWRASKRS